jgi:bile acid:Na+ symporter, BASS family
METPPTYVTALIYLFIVVYMLSVALETTQGQIKAELRDVNMIGCALLANFVIVPVLGVILVQLFPMSSQAKTGFLLLALAPGGFFALQFARVANGNRVLAVVLLFVLSVLAVLFTPILVHLLFLIIGEGRSPFVQIILLLLLLLVVPLYVGRALQQFAPAVAPKLGRLLGALSIVLFVLANVLINQYKPPTIKAISTGEVAAIVSLVLVSWAVGWLLGGPEVRNRKVFAISTSMRNVGVCLPVAASYFPHTDVFVPLLAFSSISIPMNMVFAFILGHTLRDTEASAKPVEA